MGVDWEIGIGDSDLIDIRLAARYGLKSDVTQCPTGAASGLCVRKQRVESLKRFAEPMKLVGDAKSRSPRL